MLAVVRASERLAKARRSLDAWAKGPSTPHYDSRDAYYFMTYIERRSVMIVLAAYAVLLAAVAFITYLIWGVPQRVPVGLCAMFYWLAAWPLYLRHHYKPEFRKPDALEGQEMYEQHP